MPFKTNALARAGVLAFMLFLSHTLFAQQTITGKILSNADKQPLAGATVQVKGTKTAVQTGADGSFSIQAPNANGALEISVVGFEKSTIALGGRTTIGSVFLNVSNSTLNEIVVTGYTAQKKKDITGSVSVVNVAEMKSVPAGTLESALQGQAAGVTVVNSGAPGGGSNVRVRGITTLGGSSDPLYIIDGVQSWNGIHDISMNDIESMQVLKDAGAAAIYGVRGSNGVVIVTTKHGKAGKPRISFDGFYGTQRPLKKGFDIANTQNTANAIWRQFTDDGNAPNNKQFGNGATPVIPDYIVPTAGKAGDPLTNPATYALYTNQIMKANKTGTDWFHEIFKPAPFQSHTISASGGGDRSYYYFSFSYLDQQGTLIDSYLKRYSTRINSVFNVKDHIRIGENLMLFYKQNPVFNNQNEGNAISYSYRESPIIPVYDIMGNYGGTIAEGLGNSQNPVAVQQRTQYAKANDWEIFGNAFAEVDFLKHFTIRTSIGGTVDNFYGYFFTYTPYNNAENNTNVNSFTETSGYNSTRAWTNTLTYTQKFGDHSVKALAGTEAIVTSSRGITGTRSNYYVTNPSNLTVDPSLWTLNFGNPSGQTVNNATGNSMGANNNTNNPVATSLYSLFGKVEYAYQDKYLLSGTLRRDGASQFVGSNRFGVFPSVTAGWVISQEEFMKSMDWLNFLKIRGGWGILGSLSSVSANNAYSLYGQTAGNSGYDINGTGTSSVLGLYGSQQGNPNGKWEKDKITSIGFDATLLHNSIDFSFDWYKKEVSDLLFQLPYAATAGGPTPPYVNFGNISNKGVDLAITYHGTIANDFKFDVGLTLTTYKSMVEALPPGFAYIDNISQGSNRFGAFSRTEAGHPVGAFFGYQVVGLFQNAQDTAKSPAQAGKGIGLFKYADVNHDGQIDANDRTFFGNPNPKYTAGLNIMVSYKSFDFSTFFYTSQGNDVINYIRYWTDFPQVFQGAMSNDAALHSFGLPGANGRTPILTNAGTFSNTLVFNSYYKENGSYIRCKQMQLGYSLPGKLLKRYSIDKIRVFVQATNLFTITKYTGLDPELTGSNLSDNTNFGIDFGNYPANQKGYNVGLNLTF